MHRKKKRKKTLGLHKNYFHFLHYAYYFTTKKRYFRQIQQRHMIQCI